MSEKYMLIFEDGAMAQCSEWDDLGGSWEQSFDAGWLDIVRFNREENRFEQYGGRGDWVKI